MIFLLLAISAVILKPLLMLSAVKLWVTTLKIIVLPYFGSYYYKLFFFIGNSFRLFYLSS